jgi:hypothetical protein
MSHSVSHRALAPPLALAMIHSGWYFDERGNRSDTNRSPAVMELSTATLAFATPHAASMLPSARFLPA